MTIMEILAVIGGMAVAAGACIPIAYLMDWIDGLTQSRKCKAIDNERARARAALRSDAWWFGEDMPTKNLIDGLADGRDLWSLRDEWRKARGNKAGETR